MQHLLPSGACGAACRVGAAAMAGLVAGAAHNWGGGAGAWGLAALGIAGLWAALASKGNGLLRDAAVGWVWGLAYNGFVFTFFFAATAADWLPLSPSDRWGVALLVWLIATGATSLGTAAVGACASLLRRGWDAWWGPLVGGAVFAGGEALRAVAFALATSASGVGIGKLGTLGAIGYVGISHPWGFALARVGEVWALAAFLGAVGWVIARVGAFAWERWLRTGTQQLALHRRGALWASGVVGVVVLAGAGMSPATLGFQGEAPPLPVAATSFGEVRRLSAQIYDPNALAPVMAQALQLAHEAKAGGLILPENIPFVPFVKGYSWVGEAAARLSPSFFLVTSQPQRTEEGIWVERVSVVSREGEELAHREKAALAPVGEYLPSVFALSARVLGWGKEVAFFEKHFQFVPAPEGVPFDIAGIGRMGVVVCSETFHPSVVAQASREAAWVANPASPSWFRGSRVYARAYERVAQTRAAAVGKPFMISQIQGPALAIDSLGVVRKRAWAAPGEVALIVWGGEQRQPMVVRTVKDERESGAGESEE